ncbi:glycoside hydrolase [Rhizopogon vinicolor AM-OR11-026]|uniref:glucan 1,3-beta-glucosidase n=1 Tax=Rhizopogon vinicolor AM-OR11-026 TaxID=1314800 RepID=A0A1B7MXI0_9AGAM|nr:glycoside hydrolase [Rhizopogon vinicolor AM-OR11-026]
MTSRPDNFAEVPLAAPDIHLRNNNSLGFATPETETATTYSHSFIYPPSNHDTSPLLLPAEDKGNTDLFGEEISSPHSSRKDVRPRRVVLLFLCVVLAVVVAVVLAVYFLVMKHHQDTTKGQHLSSPNAGSTSSTSSTSPTSSTSGGNGSTVITSDGSTFTYINPFGGYWVDDHNNPFNDSARPNVWTPPLSESWVWGKNKINGVNIGGLFVLEPFISPVLFERYPGAVDEWSLSVLMAADTANGGLNQIEEHYKTFITEQDIAEIAGAGLNWIRLPIPFWAIEKWYFEPFLEKVCWPYILRVLHWARKYGLRVYLDLHTIPGSQNGYNHSGRLGEVNFLNGVMGVANAQRALGYIRTIAEFISQPEWRNVVPVFGIMNEAKVTVIGMDQITSFYLQTHDMIRNITGYGEGNGPYIAIHDNFALPQWAGFLKGSDRMIMDTHPYFAFDGHHHTQPIATGTGPTAGGIWPDLACSTFAPAMDASQKAFGVTLAGEFSNGYNYCGLYLEGVGNTRNAEPSCALFLDSSQWNETMKAGIQQFALASMDALQNWFFWTWKIGPSSNNTIESPLWSYQLGLQQGWMPTDPRAAEGTCAALGVTVQHFDGIYQPYQTGGPGAGTVDPVSVSSYGQYPPKSISGLPAGATQSLLPTYTSTSAIPKLPPPTFPPSPSGSVTIGSGWFDSSDTDLAATEVAGCTYPDAWDAISAAMPTVLCPPTAGAAASTMVTSTPAIATTLPSS